MNLGRGCHRDHPLKRNQKDARDLLAARPLGLPTASVSLRSFEVPTFNQLLCEGCIGHSWAMAVAMALNAQSASPGFVPSPGDIYKIARASGRGDPSVPLSDTGSQLADAASAITKFGIRAIGELNPDGNTDVTSANVNVEPSLVELEADANMLITGEYRVDLTAPDAIATACALIEQKVPLAIGGYVDSPYMNFKAGDPSVGPPNEADPNGGGHARVITGFFVNPDGSIDFDDKTSWGDEFGDHGHVRITSGCLRAQWDCYAMTVRRAS